MSKEVEIEFKNLLSEEEYLKLMNYFQASQEQSWEQINYYYDTPSFDLKNLSGALRIRVLPDKGEITLKTPYEGFLLETTDLISRADAIKIINGDKFVPGEDVSQTLGELGIPVHLLEQKVSLTTVRYEKSLESGLLVLDKSTYGETKDYELELEVKDPVIGKETFHRLLDYFAIPKRPTPNKIQRAFSHLFLQ